jgi:hypothetical protein
MQQGTTSHTASASVARCNTARFNSLQPCTPRRQDRKKLKIGGFLFQWIFPVEWLNHVKNPAFMGISWEYHVHIDATILGWKAKNVERC